jgi:hypothetical protein
MTDKAINLAITGDEAVIDAAMDAFVKQNGWTEDSTQTKEQKAREVLRVFIMETVTAYNINAAQIAAREAAQTQTAAALDLTTMTLTVG